MRIKLLGNYWNPTFGLLWIAETAAVMCASRLIWRSDALALDVGGWAQSWVFVCFVVGAMAAMGLFSQRLRDGMAGILLRISISVVGGGVLASAILVLWPGRSFSLRALVASIALSWLFLALIRYVARGFVDQSLFRRRVLVLGSGKTAALMLELRRRTDQRGFKVAGFVPAWDEVPQVPPEQVVQVGDSLVDYAVRENIGEIVVAVGDRRRGLPLRQLLDCRLAGIEISELASFLERETGRVYLEILMPGWLIFGGGFRNDALRRSSERIFDLLASTAILALASPVMLLTALAIKLEDGITAPVLYRQNRVGYQGRVFQLRKFRSMRTDAESDGEVRWARAHDTRVTRVGALIRKLRIDELPQLINVFKGEMSFVGPRPERPEFVAQLSETIPYYEERHMVKPGITGWAQLCYPYGASEMDAMKKLQYDLYYVKNHGLIFDILILLQTVEVVVLGKGSR